MATVGWYGPLINLSEASSHIGDYVQLLVFVQKSTPIQYKVSKSVGGGGELIRTDIQVGDETRPYFPVTIWQKQMQSMIVAGEIILLQNVKITRFRDVVEARTVQCSYLQHLVHLHEMSKGSEELMEGCHVGVAAKRKLHKLIGWVRRAGLISCTYDLNRERRQFLVNWKLQKETQAKDCSSLIEIHHLPDSCQALFCASIGEIFLPITWRCVKDSEAEDMFISRRLHLKVDNKLVSDFISSGCRLCGTPINAEYGLKQNAFPLYCQTSSNRLHMVRMIYRPFMLYVWDASKYIPLLVRNKAAETLFGNISAEKVYASYKMQKQRLNISNVSDRTTLSPEETALMLNVPRSSVLKGKNSDRDPNFYLIFLLLLKLLLQQGKDDPLKIKIIVNSEKDIECGRYEMLHVSMPVFGSSECVV